LFVKYFWLLITCGKVRGRLDKELKICYWKIKMIENILEKKEEIKNIWKDFKEEEKSWDIFHNRLGEYFDGSRKDWVFFMRWIKVWKEKERSQEVETELKEFPDDKIAEIQNQNRKRTILMLKRILTEYEKKPRAFKNIPIKEISRLYQIIQTSEESARRTEIAAHKEKRETFKSLLPYFRMSPEMIEKLKEGINASFERIQQLKSGEPTG